MDLVDASAEFAFGEELDAAIGIAAARVAASRRTIALTGAGLSVESGIPPFRGPGGLWTKHGEPPMDGYERFLKDPRRAWQERLAPTQDCSLRLPPLHDVHFPVANL